MPTKQYKKRHVIIRCSGNDSKASSVSTTVSQHWTITCVWSEHQVPLEVSSTGSSQWLPLQHMIPIHQEPGSKSAYLPKWWNTWENTAVPPPSNEKHIKAQIMSKLFFLTLQVMSKTRSGQSHLSRMITVTFMAKTDPDSVRGLTWGTAAGPGRGSSFYWREFCPPGFTGRNLSWHWAGGEDLQSAAPVPASGAISGPWVLRGHVQG